MPSNFSYLAKTFDTVNHDILQIIWILNICQKKDPDSNIMSMVAHLVVSRLMNNQTISNLWESSATCDISMLYAYIFCV